MIAPIVATQSANERIRQLSLMVGSKDLQRINISAVNDGARWGETQLNRLIRKTLNVSRKYVDEAITRNTIEDAEGGITQRIKVSRKSIDLKEFAAKPVRKGVSVKVVKGEPRKTIKSAFIVKRFGGQVFKRRSDIAKTRKLRTLKGGTAVGAVTRRESEVKPILDGIGQRVLTRTASKLELFLQRQKP